MSGHIGVMVREQSLSIRGLVESDLSMRDRALYCLYEADEIAAQTKGNDAAIPLWLTAAQVFAVLSDREATQ